MIFPKREGDGTAVGQSPAYVLRGECEKNREVTKCDLKELIIQEREDRKEGEKELKTEISKGLEEVQNELSSVRTALLGLAGSITIAIIVAILEFILGKF